MPSERLARALETAERADRPYVHALMRDVLPPRDLAVLRGLGLAARGDTGGRRAGPGGARMFCGPDARARHPVLERLSALFQAPGTAARLGALCGRDFTGTFLRIEYCADTDGFWLEPHTDVGEKRMTLLIYLSDHPDAASWGTDILWPDGSLLRACPVRPTRRFCSRPPQRRGTVSRGARSRGCAAR